MPGLILGLGTQGQLARIAHGRRTECPSRADQTIGEARLDPNDLRIIAVMGQFPLAAGLALRAGHLFGLPVDRELGCVEPLSCFGLPTGVNRHRPNEVNPLGSTAHQMLSIDIAGVHEVFAG